MGKRVLIVGLALAVAVASLWRRSRGAAEAPPAPPPTVASSNGALPTREELYRQARELDVPGRSRMNKAQLALAVRARREESTNR